ncbi:MAG: hypothetical protein ACJ76I_16800 [Gaiellaceae bacterium]
MAVGDGRTFDQALRALDKLIVEQNRSSVPDPDSSVRRAYESIVAGTYGGATDASRLSPA